MRSRSQHWRWWAAAPATVGAVALLAACGSATTSPPSPTSPAAPAGHAASGTVTIKTASTSLGTVLANSRGFTLYWFARDTPTKSNCTGSCVGYWPPVIGTPTAAAGTSLPHGFGTITRSNGQKQATYDGHPLYTYAADTSAGMTSGNGTKLSGGYWWAMTPSGSKPSAAKPSSSPSTSSAAYGY
jgi:predicted lipoprotein with Yx(FWY)xxD motif